MSPVLCHCLRSAVVGEEAAGGAPDPVHPGVRLLMGVRHNIDRDPIEPLNEKWVNFQHGGGGLPLI